MGSEFLKYLFEKAQLPVAFDKEKEEKFFIYLKELCKWNEKINLTAIRTEPEIAEKLFLDSVFFLKFLEIKPDSVCLDIGSGAGFPGIPIKILVPDINLILLEARKKKASFLKHLTRVLSLKKIQISNKRFEDFSKDKSFLAKFDLITIRGVSLSTKLIAGSYNLLNQKGILLYFGGKQPQGNSLFKKTLFNNLDIKAYELPLSKSPRTLLIFRK